MSGCCPYIYMVVEVVKRGSRCVVMGRSHEAGGDAFALHTRRSVARRVKCIPPSRHRQGSPLEQTSSSASVSTQARFISRSR